MMPPAPAHRPARCAAAARRATPGRDGRSWALRVLLAVLLLSLATQGARADLLPPADSAAYRAAFAAAQRRDWDAARQAATGANEPLLAKTLAWFELLHSEQPAFAELVAFAADNPDWPLLGIIRQRAEAASDGVPDAVLLPYFGKHPPTTLKGKLRLADMLAAAGRGDASMALVRSIWVTADLDAADEDAMLARYPDALRPEDHVARLDRLLWDRQAAAARRQLPRVPEDWRRLALARLALAADQADAAARLAGVPAHLQNDPGLLLERVRWNRRSDALEQAAQLLRQPSPDLVRPAAWWGERDALAHRLLDEGNNTLAYSLAAWHGLGETGAELADAEFLAGWIALRRIGDAKTAYEHFTRLYDGVKTPISRSRGAYWAGRAAAQQGRREDAARWFAIAAEYRMTFYGQLAAAELGDPAPPAFAPEPQPSPPDRERLEQNELVRVARMLSEIGQGDLTRPFLLQVAAAARTPPELKLVATLARELGDPDVELAAAKRAGAQGVTLIEDAYPVIPLAGAAPDAPLVLAVVRQESAFDKAAVSRSDARGLMQLKPATAKDVARRLSLPFSAGRLLADGSYNVTLGRAYLANLFESFAGSYVLAIAAYNAGPARVQAWLGTYGDPRTGGVDALDWIESLPFGETRNYVQRVLENLQVYRLRLGDVQHAFTLPRDLKG